jgi:hypothetical protein
VAALAAVGALDAGVHVDAGRFDGKDGVPDIARVETAGDARTMEWLTDQ